MQKQNNTVNIVKIEKSSSSKSLRNSSKGKNPKQTLDFPLYNENKPSYPSTANFIIKPDSKRINLYHIAIEIKEDVEMTDYYSNPLPLITNLVIDSQIPYE